MFVKKVLLIIMIAGLTACNDTGADNNTMGGSADITIDDTNHHFTKVECFEGFSKDLNVLLVNDKINFEVSQLKPSQGTWTVKYNIPLDDNKYNEYFTRNYDISRNGNNITGTALAESGKDPKKTVNIKINVVCQKF